MPGEQSSAPVSMWQRLLSSLRGRRPTMRFSVALATLLIMLVGGLIFVSSRRRQQQREAAQIQKAREEQEQQAREQEMARQQPPTTPQPAEKPPDEAGGGAPSGPQPTPQLPPNPTVKSAPPVAFLTLRVGGVRGGDSGQTQLLVIPPGTTQAQLLLTLKDNSYSRYRVSLEKIGGAEIFTQTDLKPRSTKSGASFVFTVPARKFANGDYALTVSGINPDGDVDDLSKSLFRIEKR